MTKGEFIEIGFDCMVLAGASGLKLGPVRHLRNIMRDARALDKERSEIASLKPDASEEEIKEAINEFNSEEYKPGFAVIPSSWFDDVSSDAITVKVFNEKGEEVTYYNPPIMHLESLIEKGVVK